MGSETKQSVVRAGQPDRREVLKLGACLGTGLVVGLAGVGVSSSASAGVVTWGARRVRPGGPVEVRVQPAAEGLTRAAVHVVHVDAEGRWLGTVGMVWAMASPGGLVASVVAPRVQGAGELVRLVAVYKAEDGEVVVSSPLEVVCTPQIPGL